MKNKRDTLTPNERIESMETCKRLADDLYERATFEKIQGKDAESEATIILADIYIHMYKCYQYAKKCDK